MDLTGNTIFIPGATSGIGLALAQRLQALGNTVIIGGRSVRKLADVAAQGFETQLIDTSDLRSIELAAQSLIPRHPQLNVVVAMAGIMEVENWHSASGFLEVAERTIATNLLGPIRLAAAFLEQLQRRPKAALLTVSSGLAHVPLAPTPTYNATKAAIHALSEAVRMQLADTSVQVIEIVPPAVRTALMGQEEAEYAMPLDAFADEVISLLGSEPDAGEILVEGVKFLRYAEVNGEYEGVIAALNHAVSA